MDNNLEMYKKPQGKVNMILHDGGKYNNNTGKIEGGKIITQKTIKNLIVNDASLLMACRMHPNDSETGENFVSNGLQYLAVGVGILQDDEQPYNPTNNPVDTTRWDLQNPPSENYNDASLKGEIFRKKFTGIDFVDPNSGDVSDYPTNILRLETTFNENEAIGPLTEMGIFGGDYSEENNKQYMFNYKTFAVWNKPEGSRLTIIWELTF